MCLSPTGFHDAFGQDVKMLELCDLKERVYAVTEQEVQQTLVTIRDFFESPPSGADPIAGPVTEDVLEYSARVAVWQEHLVEDFDLSGMAYYHVESDGSEDERFKHSRRLHP